MTMTGNNGAGSGLDSIKTKWWTDIHYMHHHYGFHDTVKDFDADKLKTLLQFRVDFLAEELDELKANLDNPEEIVDACIDLIVVAIGTLDLYDVDLDKAWDEVHAANMNKQRGIKEGRPNPLGMPDLLKPKDWKAPSHEGNHGRLTEIE